MFGFGENKQKTIIKDIKTGAGYSIRFDGKRIRVLDLGVYTYKNFDQIDDHLIHGFKLVSIEHADSNGFTKDMIAILEKPLANRMEG